VNADENPEPNEQQLHGIKRALASGEAELQARLDDALIELDKRARECERLARSNAQLQQVLLGAGQDLRAVLGNGEGEPAAADLQALVELDAAHVAERAELQRQIDALHTRLLESERQSQAAARRSAAEHASQLLGLQQRASNERDTLSLAQLQHLQTLQEQSARMRDDLVGTYSGLLQQSQKEQDEARARLRRADDARAAAQAQHQEQVAHAAAMQQNAAVLGARLTECETVLAALLSHLESLVRGHAQQLAAEQQQRASLIRGAQARESALLNGLHLDPATRPVWKPHSNSRVDSAALSQLRSEVTVMPQPLSPATSLPELLALQDERFVACAYLTILKRPADDAGLAGYVTHLRAGMSKPEVLTALAGSDEGRAAGCDLAGLDELLQEAQPRRPSLLGRLITYITRDSQVAMTRQMYRIENNLGRLAQESADRLVRLEELVVAVRRQSEHRQQVLVDILAAAQAPGRVAQGAAHGSTDAQPLPAATSILDASAVERARLLLQRPKAAA
jgi:hypothetical protein